MHSSTLVSGLFAGLAAAAGAPLINSTVTTTQSATVDPALKTTSSVSLIEGHKTNEVPTGSVSLTTLVPTAATPGQTVITETVLALTTYCPAATEITTNGKTYTVTTATTLTITDCPCTIKKTVPVAQPTPVSAGPPVYKNGTVWYTTETVATLTTYCPAPTTVITNGFTFPVPKPTTLTISEACPCTTVRPVTAGAPGAPGVPGAPGAPGAPASAAPPAVATPNTPAGNVPVAPSKSAGSSNGGVAAPSGKPVIATGAAATIGSSIMAVAAGLFAIVA